MAKQGKAQRYADGGQVNEDPVARSQRLRAEMASKYGAPSGNAQQETAPPQRPQPPQPPQAPQQARPGTVRGYIDERRKALNYADGGEVGMRPPMGNGSFINAAGYANGGQIGAPGMAPPQAGQMQGMGQSQPLDPRQLDDEIAMVLKHPQASAEITQAVQDAVNEGDITIEELMKLGQLAKAAQMNPQIWPQLRQFVIQQGIAGPEDVPPTFDQGLVAAILIAAQAAQRVQQAPRVIPPQGMGQGPQASGPGLLQGPGTGTSDSIPAQNLANGGQVNVSTGEYIIPADVVKAKGVDFFDGMVKKYHRPTGYKG